MISVAIFTLDEEVNLPSCLRSLAGCDDVVVVDSFSADRTREIAREHGARVFEHAFTGFGDQRMWCLEHVAFKHPWVLILDADERGTPALWDEMLRRVGGCPEKTAAFQLKRRFYWGGKWLRHANLYPTWIVRLVRVGRVRYINRGHAETQEVDGQVESLEEDLIDENHKGLAAWRERQRHYAEAEAVFEARAEARLEIRDLWSGEALTRRAAWKRLGSRLPARGLCYFLYAWLLRSGWRDGAAGLRFCFEKARFQALTGRLAGRLREGG